MAIVFIGLGSNIEPERNLRAAVEKLRKLFPDIHFSSVYRTAPQDVTNQPDFLNAVARIETDLHPKEILAMFQEIEQDLGKAPPFPQGPRTIDLDLLLYDDLVFPSLKGWQSSYKLPAIRRGFRRGSASPRLTAAPRRASYKLLVPHPRIHLRCFVLEPLCELTDPQRKHPVLEATWQELLRGVMDQRCERITLRL